MKLLFGVLIGMRCLQEIEEVLKVKLDGGFEKWGYGVYKKWWRWRVE